MPSKMLKRYAPLLAVAAVQLFIIAALAPSKAPAQVTTAAGPNSGGPGSPYSNSTVPGQEGQIDPSTGLTLIDPVTGQPAINPATGQPITPGGPNAQAGDTSHCVGDRQFDPAIDFYAPPCVPVFAGGDNGGATYQGVTGDTIKVIRYYGQGHPAVDAILVAQDAYVSIEQHREFQAAVQTFINERYELYGRQIELSVFQGNCSTIPPNNQCLRDEMRTMVTDEQPFFVMWNSSLSSETFDELSRLQTPNAGGWHFRDSFNQARRPYHWDVQMSGTRLALHAARWWCQQMNGQPTEYAGTGNPTENLNGRPRSLGVIATNDPENQATVEIDFAQEVARCGGGYGQKKYFYAQDITTVDQQRRAAVLRMRQAEGHDGSTNPATSIMCFCDLVAPIFLYAEEQTQHYYPENIVVGAGLMDADVSAQAYMGDVGCNPALGPCNFEDAFGISSLGPQEAQNGDAGYRVWRAGGGGETPPFESAAMTVEWDYYNLIAGLIQGAGPQLNPQNMESGAFAAGARGDATHSARGFFPGNYAWNLDMRVVYWSTVQASPYNNEAGTYIDVYNRRFAVDQWATVPRQLQLPGKPR